MFPNPVKFLILNTNPGPLMRTDQREGCYAKIALWERWVPLVIARCHSLKQLVWHSAKVTPSTKVLTIQQNQIMDDHHFILQGLHVEACKCSSKISSELWDAWHMDLISRIAFSDGKVATEYWNKAPLPSWRTELAPEGKHVAKHSPLAWAGGLNWHFLYAYIF